MLFSLTVYGFEVCTLSKGDLRSLNFTATRFFLKLFRILNSLVIADYQTFFAIESSSVRLEILTCKCVVRYKSSGNNLKN